MDKIERELRFLKVYAGLLTLVCAVLFAIVFRASPAKSFTEINVERINVVEANGKLRMVIANQARQHPGVMDEITYEERKGRPALGTGDRARKILS